MKFLVIDDHEMVREGLCAVLSGLYGHLDLVQAGSIAEGRQAIRNGDGFDLAILDMMLPDGSGMELMDELDCYHPEVPMIVVSADARFMHEAMRRGALGFLPKSADSNELLEAIGSVLAGEVYLPNSLALGSSRAIQSEFDEEFDRAVPRDAPSPSLSARQKSVLRLIMQGLSNRDIAQRLSIAESTIKIHVSAILKALKVTSRTQAVLTATRMKSLF